MAILNGLERRNSPESPSFNLNNAPEWLYEAWGAGKNASGVSVNEASALRSSVVFACVRILAESVASLPLMVYERLEHGKRVAKDHPLHRLLHDQANAELPAFAFREVLQAHAVSWGNAYAEIEFNNAGMPIALWPLMPDRTTVERVNGRKVVITEIPGGRRVGLPAEKVLHIPGLGFDGMTGYSVIRMAAQSIGLGMATEAYGAAFFGNGARPAGALKHPKPLNDKARDNIRKGWEAMHGGLDKSHRLAILDEGMEYVAIGLPPEDSQFLETRKFQVADQARWFRVPPHMVGDLEKATNNNIEHQSLEFVMHTLRPWLVRWEQWIQRSLFSQADQGRYFAEFKVDALLRGDIKSRYEALAIAKGNGVINADEWRELENMNPQPDEQGKVYLVQQNMAPVDKLMEILSAKQAQPAQGFPAPESKARNAVRTFAQAAAEQVVRRQVNATRNALKKHSGDLQAFRVWVDEFFEKEGDIASRAFAPVLSAAADLGISVNIDARSLASSTADGFRAILSNPETAERRMIELLDMMEEARAGALADQWTKEAA